MLCICTLEELKKLTESVKTAVSDAYKATGKSNGKRPNSFGAMKTIFSAYKMKSNLLLVINWHCCCDKRLQKAWLLMTCFGVPFADGELDEPQAHSCSFCFQNLAVDFGVYPRHFSYLQKLNWKIGGGYGCSANFSPGFPIKDREHNTMLHPEVEKRALSSKKLWRKLLVLWFQATRRILRVTFLQIHFLVPWNIWGCEDAFYMYFWTFEQSLMIGKLQHGQKMFDTLWLATLVETKRQGKSARGKQI